jgi:hypothetical protein
LGIDVVTDPTSGFADATDAAAAAAPTDFLLLRCELPDSSSLADAARSFCSEYALVLHRAAWAADSHTAIVYARLHARAHVPASALPGLANSWQACCPSAAKTTVSRLEEVFERPGRSTSETPVFHYAVETDPETGWAAEIFRWYDTQHMPGLAAVPGCIHARRLLNHDHGLHGGLDHGPLSFACYDLVTQETLGSPAWLAVRGTAWSDITRPHFTNTRRTMMRVLA